MRLIVTDLTEMHGGNYCTAGWDTDAHRMIRPLPNGANWTAVLLQQNGISPGITVDVNPTGQQQQSAFPHRTEDTVTTSNGIQVVNAVSINWLAADAPPTHQTVQGAFGGSLHHSRIWNGARQGVHIEEGTQIDSLSAVSLPVNHINLFEDEYNGRRSLRAYIEDEDARYNLPVVSRSLREAYRANGVAGAQQLLPAQGLAHVRLGVARAWPGQPGRCSLMINGIYG